MPSLYPDVPLHPYQGRLLHTSVLKKTHFALVSSQERYTSQHHTSLFKLELNTLSKETMI